MSFFPGSLLRCNRANDVENYTQTMDQIRWLKKKIAGYPFPYLPDESQGCKSLSCRLHAGFLPFIGDRELVYRGQFDDGRPGNGRSITGKDLRSAIEKVIAGGQFRKIAKSPALAVISSGRLVMLPSTTARV